MIHMRISGMVSLALLCVIEGQQALADTPSVARLGPLTQLEQAEKVSWMANRNLGHSPFPQAVAAIPASPVSDVEAMRQAVRQSRYGERGLRQIFRNFEGSYSLDPTIPGVEKNIRFLGSLSKSQAKGAVRTLLYGTAAHNDPRFRLIGMDRPIIAEYGKTDMDLVLEHRATGEQIRIEVKDVKPASQRADMGRLKEQVTKMAADKRITGRQQAWVNRQETLPEIKEFARENGIPVYENIKQNQFRTVLDDLDQRAGGISNANRIARGFAVLGIAGSGMLGWEAYKQSQYAWAMWSDPVLRKTALPYLQAGFAGGRLLESASLGLSEAARFELLGKGGLSVFGRTAGRSFLPIAVGAEGVGVSVTCYEYSIGRISKRDFYRRTTGPAIFGVFTTGGAIIGGIAGAPEGGVGALPGAAIGANIGALVAVPVQFTADWTWNWYYRNFDEKQRAAVDEAVNRHYGLPSQ